MGRHGELHEVSGCVVFLASQLSSYLTGTTLHTVSRILSGWEQAGLIESGRQRIVLREPERIYALAEQPPGGA